MQDEHFQRQWTQSHHRFSHDIDSGLDKLREVLTAAASTCGGALLRKADATGKAVIIGFITGAVLGAALLASAGVTSTVPAEAAKAASVRIDPARLVLA